MIDGAVSMKQLGKQMRCDPSFITVVADELEERGLAKRAVDADDRRVKNLVLTRKGSALRTELTQRFAEAPALRCLDDRQRTDLAGLLRTMLDADAAACEPTGTPEPVAADAATGGRRQRAPARSAPR
jgi:DNA-binding MarR family transcriptional regulator